MNSKINYLSGRFDILAEEGKEHDMKMRVCALEIIHEIVNEIPDKRYYLDIDNDEVVMILCGTDGFDPHVDALRQVYIDEDGVLMGITADDYVEKISGLLPNELEVLAGNMLMYHESKKAAEEN